MTHYEMAEKLSEKMGVTLEKATEALEACDWELLDAALMLEKENGQNEQAAWTSCDTTTEDKDAGEKAREQRRGVVRGLGEMIRDLDNKGDINGDVLVLLLIFAFWVCVPLLVVGLFVGCRYTFSGAELGRENVNSAMNKAAEVAEKVKEEFKGEH